MSTNGLTQQTSQSILQKKPDKKKTICGACHSELEPDHAGIQCVQGDHFCVDCSQQIVSMFFAEPQHHIPLRCVVCRIELNTSVFERQLSPEQLDFYHQHMLVLVWAKDLLNEDERLDNCPFCSNAVIRSINDTNIFYCDRPDCKKTSCLVCRKECPRFLNDYGNEDDQLEMIKHFTCSDLAEHKKLFDKAVEDGQKGSCPKCGLSGMKDDSCAHMTCPTCAQVWCYFCGKAIEQCDKHRGEKDNGIYDHNYHWDTNPNRCPMYFTQIQDIDRRWPDNDEECMVMFHRIRSLGLLRDVYKQIGSQRIRELNDHFNILNSCGFTEKEILQEDLTFIRRPIRHLRQVLRRQN